MRFRLLLLALPVILAVLSLVACGGKGGGGY
jgi:predicted small lipoprotein YifL